MPRNEAGALSPAIDDARRSKRMVNTGFAVGIGALVHPLQVSKVLIQLGYEPWPLQKGRAWYFFGAEKRYLPNGLEYSRRLYQDYGLTAIYRGVGASICGGFVGAMTSMFVEEKLIRYYGLGDVEEPVAPHAPPSLHPKKFITKVARGSLSKVAGIIVARPFQVVLVRMIAQHIGGEDIYRGVFGSLRQIGKEEGFGGLFAGLLPQILCELCTFWTVSSVLYLVDYLWQAYVDTEERNADDEEDRLESTPPKTLKNVIGFTVPYVANSIFYPLSLVSNVMAVNGSSLIAGMPPFVPTYPTWQDCFHDLSAKDQLKRGSKLFFRFYEKPITYRYGDVYAIPNA